VIVPSGFDRALMGLALALAVVVSPPLSASTFGVNAHTPSGPVQDTITDAGIRWVRIDVIWAAIETNRDSFHWDFYDQLIDNLESRGLRIMATLQGTPQWATSGSEFSGVPDNPDDFREFCYALASRYGDRIDAWAFWNEPNLHHFWEGGRYQYINQILIPGIEAVQRVDPAAMVLGPDLAHLSSADWDDWLDDVVSETRDLLDVVTHHVYPSDGSAADVTEKLNDGGQFPWEPPSVRSVLEEAGWRDRPVWLTETGVQSDVYGELGQEDFYEDLLWTWFGVDRSHSWISRIFFYEMVDPPDHPSNTWGILHPPPGLEPKLAYHAYQAFITDAVIDDAEITINNLPQYMGSQDTAEVSVVVRNTGTTSWRAEDGYQLIFDIDSHGWIHVVEPIAIDEPVEPGQWVELIGTVGSPSIAPTYPAQSIVLFTRMVRVGKWQFGDAPNSTIIHTAYDPAEITSHPAPAEAPYGGVATFSVEAISTTQAQYQWRRNTVVLDTDHRYSGTRTPELTVTGIAPAILGDYDCVVTNAAGPVASGPGNLSLNGPPIRRPSGRTTGDPRPVVDRWIAFVASRPAPAPRNNSPTPEAADEMSQ